MSGIDLDDGKCHFKDDGVTGCGTLIYEEDSQRCYGYESDYFFKLLGNISRFFP
jgi:hypothetical protein